MELEIRTCRARTSPKAADYIHLSRLFAKYAFFGLWQSSEDQDLSVPVISVLISQRVGYQAPMSFQTAGQTIPLCPPGQTAATTLSP
jgi:hypothetical protein